MASTSETGAHQWREDVIVKAEQVERARALAKEIAEGGDLKRHEAKVAFTSFTREVKIEAGTEEILHFWGKATALGTDDERLGGFQIVQDTLLDQLNDSERDEAFRRAYDRDPNNTFD